MSEMVERVAVAIEEGCAGCDPRDKAQFVQAARDALAVLREPTEDMLRAVFDFVFEDDGLSESELRERPTEFWHAMIDEALK